MGKRVFLLVAIISSSTLWGVPSPKQQASSQSASVVPTNADVVASSESASAEAQASPWLLRFSGVTSIQGADQQPENCTFSIYSEQRLGTALWTEVQQVPVGKDGRYNVLLGAKTPGGLPPDVFATTELRWLGVRVGNQEEEPRILLVAVPYAIRAMEAEKLAGHAASDFVTSEALKAAVRQEVGQIVAVPSASPGSAKDSGPLAAAQPAATTTATNFVDSTSDQVVSVQQDGSGTALTASAPDNAAVVGLANGTAIPGIVAGIEGITSNPAGFAVYGRQTSPTAPNGVGPTGIYGSSDSPNGVGITGWARGSGGTIGVIAGASSTGGIALDASETSSGGNTVGLVARVRSPVGTSALLLNTAGGPLLTAQTNQGIQFSVDGGGNVLAAGGITSASSIRAGQLISTAAPGTVPLQVTSTSQVPNLNASFLGGLATSGFIQNRLSEQTNTSFNIDGNGTVGGLLTSSSAKIGTDPSTNGQVAIMPDNLDTVHSWIGQAGSQMHFRLSRANASAPKDFLIVPYDYGTAIEYPGVIEVWSSALSVHMNHSLGGNSPAYFWVGDQLDLGGLFATAYYPSSAGPNGNITIAADKFDHTSHGKMYFTVRNPDDAFVFNWGPYSQESPYAAIRRVISGQQMQTNVESYSGAVTGAMIADSTNNAVRFGSRSVHPVQIFTGDGWGKVFVYPSGNVAIGTGGDVARLAVGDSSQFQVSSQGALTIGGGTPIIEHLSVTGSVSFVDFSANSCQTVSLYASGASDGDTVALGIPSVLASIDGLTWFGFVSAQDMASIRTCNITTVAITNVPSGTARVDIWKH